MAMNIFPQTYCKLKQLDRLANRQSGKQTIRQAGREAQNFLNMLLRDFRYILPRNKRMASLSKNHLCRQTRQSVTDRQHKPIESTTKKWPKTKAFLGKIAILIVFGVTNNAQGVDLPHQHPRSIYAMNTMGRIIKKSKLYSPLLAQTDKNGKTDDITSELEDIDEDITDEFEEDLKSDLEGDLEVDEADLIDEELVDIEREEIKQEETLIEEEFKAQQEKSVPTEEEPILGEEDEDLIEEDSEQLAEEEPSQESPPETIPLDEDLAEVTEDETLLADEEPDQGPSGSTLDITDVDFLHDQNGGTVVIRTTGVPQVPSIRSSEDGRQIIVEIENVRLPDRFKRPYATREFPSNIGFFQAYQERQSKTARFVVQMRQSIEPLVRVEGNSVLIEAQGSEIQELADTQSPLDSQNLADNGESMASPSGKPLNASSSEDLLSQGVQFSGNPISIEVSKADIRNVLEFITNESGLNMVFSENVKGTVTLKLRDIPWDQAFILVLQMKKLGYIKNGDILVVDTVNAIQSEIQERQQLLDSKKNLEPLQVQILPINYAKAQDITNQIQLFKSQRGQIQVDQRTNSLIITDISENIRRMRELIRNLDVQIPQVLIEGKVIEANERFNRRFGLALTGQNLSSIVSSFNVQNSTGGSQTLSLDLSQIVGLDAGALSAILDMLEEEEVVRVLSSPRVVTLNNMAASIQQTEQIPISKSDATGGSVSSGTEYKDITFSLNVTPQVTSGEGIILQISIQRQFTGTAVAEGAAPPVFGRSANTNVMVNNGDTAVIGGIYQTSNTKTRHGVPLLRSLPLIGSLFRQNVYETSKTELLIFLTPRVLNRNETFALNRNDDLYEEEVNRSSEVELEDEFDNL